LQSEWLTLGRYPLPGKKLLADNAKNMNLTIELEVIGSVIYQKLNTIDEYMKANPVCDKNYHTLVRRDEEKQRVYLKFKVYLDTALYDKDRNRIPITSLHDFYQYLREDKKIRIVFAFSKMWKMSNEYGFSLSAKRIQLADAVEDESAQEEEKSKFL
jgi:hypothetical protein